MTELSIAAGVVAGMMEFATSRGASREVLIARSGISPEDLEDFDNRIPLNKYQALVNAGKELCNDPALSLHYAEAVDLAEVSIVGLITRAAETMVDAFAQINRYGRLVAEVDGVGEGDRYKLIERGDDLWLVDTRKNLDDFPELVEGPFAFMVCGVRQFTDAKLMHEVHLTRKAPEEPREYERIFGAPVVFESDWNAMRADKIWTSYKVALTPPYVFGILSEHADTLLNELDSAKSMRSRVEALLMSILHTGNASMDLAASKLGMSQQTLYRNLKAEDVTFEKLLDELRHKLALHYLSGKKVSVNETAYLVGFSDPSAFSRAFKRWTGKSPSTTREQ